MPATRALCIGNGPSLRLYSDDEWQVMREQYDFVFAVNRFYIKPPPITPDFLVAIDWGVFRDHVDDMDELVWGRWPNCTIVCTATMLDLLGWDWVYEHGHQVCVMYLDLSDKAYGKFGSRWPCWDDPFMEAPNPRNVMLCAVPLAIDLGCAEVDVIGCDMTNHNVHFYDTASDLQANVFADNTEEHGKPLSWARDLEIEVQENWRLVKGYADERGCTLRNLTRGGNRILALGGSVDG